MKEQINIERLPRHIAIIMDGNGRWAKEHGKPRLFGHQSAIQSVREVNEACAELGVEYLTLYAFSTENWNRPGDEVSGLMTLLSQTIKKETATLLKNGIRLNVIGDVERMRLTCSDSAYQLALIQLAGTGLDIVAYSVAVQNLCIVKILKMGFGVHGLIQMFDAIYGESSYNAQRAERIYQQATRANLI